jgi:hypothetical protein
MKVARRETRRNVIPVMDEKAKRQRHGRRLKQANRTSKQRLDREKSSQGVQRGDLERVHFVVNDGSRNANR